MAQQLPHVIPSIYLANYLNDFEPLFPRYGVTLRKFSKGTSSPSRASSTTRPILSKAASSSCPWATTRGRRP